MARALILGGTGMIGQAAARRLLAAGWQVDVAGRDPTHMPADIAAAGGRFIQMQRGDSGELGAALGSGVDLLVDCICFTAADARNLLPMLGSIGSTVMISSKAVYVDTAGNHSNTDEAPRFDGPIKESQPTIAPGTMDYNSREGYGANKVAAEQVLLESGFPVTVVRPSKVHGVGSTNPREWVFVKRILDKRPAVFLARYGSGTDHTTAAGNIAALIETVAANPGRRILNCADPDAPSGLEIAQTIADYLDYEWDEVLLSDSDPSIGALGDHPWNVKHSIVLDTSASLALGYTPAGRYAETVTAEIDWLVAAARGEIDVELPAVDDPFFGQYFDYAAEDAFLAGVY